MRFTAIALLAMLCTGDSAIAQSAGGSSLPTGAGGQAGSTLSNGSTINGTGGSPGPNTSNALNHGTTGSTLGTPQTGTSPPGAAASHGNAVDTPAANAATQNLGSTDAGVLRK